MSKPPPPRYKIIERSGRLVTIDTWANDTPATTAVQAPVRPRSMQPPRPFVGPRGLAAIGDLLLAALVPVKDEDGRRLLTTAPSWDKKGSRTIALSPRSEQRLSRVLAVALLVVLAGIAAVMIDPDLFLVALVLAVVTVSSFATVAQEPVTRFLDTLDEDLPR